MALDLTPLSPELYSTIDFGKYINQDSTFDEKRTLSVQSTLKATGISSFAIRFDENVNGVVGQPDDPLSVYLVTRGNFRVYGPAEVRSYIVKLYSLATEANLTRIYRDER